MALQGDLQAYSLTNLIQMNCQSGVSGCLALRHNQQTGRIYFQDGEIVHAALGSLTGIAAFDALLHWDTGEFYLNPADTAPLTSIQARWTDLLLRGVQKLDEQQAAHPGENSAEDGLASADLGALFGLEPAPQTIHEAQENTMADLDNLLRNLGNDIPGFIAVTLAGSDGLLIGYYSKKADIDPELISAQFALVMSLVRRVASKLDAGAVEDNLVTMRDFYVINQSIGNGSYWLGVMASRDTKLGALRMYLRQYLPTIAKALPEAQA